MMIKLMYITNIIVAGWISVQSLFYPRSAWTCIFEENVAFSCTIQLVGALWFAIFILSIIGLWFPTEMGLVLVFQLIYKSLWLLAVAVPALKMGVPFPKGMACFFLIWVIILPWIIPWKELFPFISKIGE